jgi:hypothetical protein
MSQVKVIIPGPPPTEAYAYVDVETAKVPTPEGFTMPSGEPLRKRWRVIAAGAARGNTILLQYDESEEKLLKAFGRFVDGADAALYCATRDFDEMILRGRFTNARRAHLPTPTWPAMPGAEKLYWHNEFSHFKDMEYLNRDKYVRTETDLPPKDVPDAWAAGHRDEVLVHLLRDVVELVWRSNPWLDELSHWAKRILTEGDERYAFGFAERVLNAYPRD